MLRLTIQPTNVDAFREEPLTEVHTWRDLGGSVCAYGYVGGGARWIRWPGVVAFRFDDEGSLVAYPESAIDAAHIIDLCRRTVEPLVLQSLGWETLHASAALMPPGVVAFCGERESGKSTIAYSLSRRGHRQLSDDTIVVQIRPEEIRALDLPFAVRLRQEPAAFFGFQTDTSRQLQDVVPMGLEETGPVRTETLAALFVLGRTAEGGPIVSRLAPSSAFTTILAHAHCFNPEDVEGRRRLLDHYLHMAATVPVYELRFSAGLDRLDAVMECIERTVCDVLEASPV